jgi:non-specific serine/threonine protein kinase
MALPVAKPPAELDVTETAAAERSPRRVSASLPLVDRPWTPRSTPVPAPRSPDEAATVWAPQAARPVIERSPSQRPYVERSPSQRPPIELPPAPPPPGPRHRLPAIAVVVTVIALVASLTVAGIFLLRERTQAVAPPPPAPEEVTDAVPASAWRALAESPTPRQQVATTVADGTVWVLGGLTDSGATTKVEGFDPAINTWKHAIDLPVPLHHAMAVTYRGEIIVLGGWQPDGANLTAISSKKVFAQRGGGWVELPPMNDAHVAGGAVVVGDRIVVTGGQANGQLVPSTEVFDGTSWRKVANLPTPREHLAMVTDGTFAYVLGGRNLGADKNTDAVERYDPATQKWTSLAPLPSPRGGLGAAVADGRIVVVGGEDPTNVLGGVDAYDIQSGKWTSWPKMTTARHGAAVAAVGKTVYVLDGAVKPSHSASTAISEAFDVPPRRLQPAAAWRAVTDAPVARQFTGSAVIDGTLWVVGGLTTGEATSQTWAYDAAIDRWKQGPDLPIPLHHTSAVDYKGELVVIGGWTPANGNMSGLVSDKVFALRAGKWVELPPLRRPRVAAAAATVGDKIVLAGGQSSGQLMPITEVFDGTAWTDAAPIPTPREHLAATTDGKYVYVIGGRQMSSDKNSAAFERFDPAKGTWQKLPDMPTARGGVGAACFDGRIIAAGGEEPTRVLDTVEAYDIATGSWTGLANLGVARHGMAVAAVGHSVLAVNGAKRPTHAESAATVEALDFS